MTTTPDWIASLPSTIEGYDFAREKSRYGLFRDVTVGGATLNRGRARIEVRGDMDPPRAAKVREEHLRHVFLTTHQADSPVVELGWPTAGSYGACEAGVYLDCMLGVAQRILDENHPAFERAIERLARNRLLFRREIATDDFLDTAPWASDIHPPQAVAALMISLAEREFPIVGGWKVFFSNSGAEAVEAGMKLAMLVRYRRLVERYGIESFERVCRELEIPRNEAFEARDRSLPDPLWRDYPLFFFAFEGAFHGRTLGALSLTQSKKAHQIGHAKLRWVRHFPWNAGAAVADAIDERDLPQILESEGGVRGVLAKGRVPKDLIAAFVAEPFQGEGGYRLADRKAFQDLGAVLKRNGILFMIDEVQTFGRTGTAFCSSTFLNEPDIIATAKGAVIGITLGRAEFARHLHPGWHSNTWGGGKIFDNEMAWATLDALKNWRDPVLDGLPYFDNCRIKGKLLAAALDRLAERYPDILVAHSGVGLMHGITLRRRDEVVSEAWRRGLKLLGCGLPGETARVRILFLADAIAKEIEDFAATFGEVLAALSQRKPAAAGKR
jgi:4-aminobutyrate aminotransferase-like enzyme